MRHQDKLIEEAHTIANRARELLIQFSPVLSKPEQTKKRNFRLAHYTSLEALLSMLQGHNGGLRLSHSSMMNDPEEGSTTADGRLIKKLLCDGFDLDSWIRCRYEHAHMCCFVGLPQGPESVIPGDDLLYWRLYGNNCRGLSISFASHQSVELVESGFVNRVSYSEDPPSRIDSSQVMKIFRDFEKLRKQAIELSLWESIFPVVLPKFDRLMTQRFLHKHVNYSMESEYRAVKFLTGTNNAPEDQEYLTIGRHVQYQRIRSYVQTEKFLTKQFLTTKSNIAIGSNLPENHQVCKHVAKLITDTLGLAPSVVSIAVSKKKFRSI